MTKPQTPSKHGLIRCTLSQVYALSGLFAVALILFTTLAMNFHQTHVSAATNSTLNFQARLEANTGAIAPDGTYNIQFKLYNVSSGGAALWTETYQNSASQGVTVTNGYVSVNLGSLTAFPTTINWDQNLYLTMNIGGTSAGASPTYDGEMTPRLQLTSVPYAFRAGSLATYNAATTFTSTLSILAPTGGNQTFQIPDQTAAGTYSLLTTNTANNSFIQLQATTPGTAQTGNFNITGTGIAGILQATTSVKTPLLDTASAGTLAIGSTNATAITIGNATSNILTTVNGNAVFMPTSGNDSLTAFQVLKSDTSVIFNVDTTNKRVGINTATPGYNLDVNGSVRLGGQALSGIFSILTTSSRPILVVDSTATNQLNLQTFAAATAGTQTHNAMALQFTGNYWNGAANVNQSYTVSQVSATSGILSRLAFKNNAGTEVASFNDDGSVLFKTSTNTATGFQVQNTAGNSIFTVDTTTPGVVVGKASTVTGQISFANATNANTATIQSGITTGSYTTVLPTAIGAANQCLSVTSIAGSTQNLGYISCATTSGAPYVTLQPTTPGTADTGSFNISGTGIASILQAATSVKTPILDTASAGTLTVGNTNATAIALGNATNNILTTINGTLLVKPTPTHDSTTAFQVQNAAGNAVLTVDTSGATVNFGKVSAVKGKLIVYDGPTSNFGVTLSTNVLTADRNITFSDESGTVCLALSVNCGFLTGSAASGTYVQLQATTPGTAQTGNFNISGTGIAASLQSTNLSVTTQATVQNVSDGTTELRALTSAGNYLLNVNASNGYVINNGTRGAGNQIQNGSFESGGNVTSGEQGWTGPAQATIVNSSADANSGNYELQVATNGTTVTTYTGNYFRVATGDIIYAEGWVKNSAGANGTGGVILEGYDKDKAFVGSTSDAASLPGTSYVLRKVTYTVPSGVVYVRVGATVNSSATTGTYYFDDFYMSSSVAGPGVFKNSADSSTAFLIQSAGAAQTLFTADTTNNILKVGDSTGTDTATTIFVLDSATANPTTGLASKNGGLFYRSDTGSLKAIIGGTVVDVCTTAVTCSGYSASATSSIQLQATSPGSQQTGNFNISGTGVLSQLQSNDVSTASTNSPNLVIRSGNATGTSSNSGSLTLDVGTATGTLGQITIGHTNVATVMPGTLDVQGANTLKLGTGSSNDGSILFRNSVGANTITLKAAAANPASSITLTLPTALGSAGYCLKDTGGGALGFSDCGVGATVTMQNVYDDSSPASVLLSNAKDFTLTAQNTGTSPNILFNLQCSSSCGTNGRFAVQNGGTDVFVVKPNSGGIVLGAATQVGSATTDATQINLQLDSSNAYADSGSCTTTSNQGAMYYNTASQSIRTCQDGSWSDVLTTKDLGLIAFGVVPNSGSSNQGDLPALVTAGASGPCKVSWASATSVSVQSCVAYSGGRRVSVTATTITISGMTTTNIWANICLTGTGNQPALSTAVATEASTTAGFYPSFSATAPVVCLAQIKGSASSANTIAGIYDTRAFTGSSMEFATASTAVSLGMLVDVSGSNIIPSVTGSKQMYGVVVATDGGTSSTSPNVIIVTRGPVWAKATAGTAGQYLQQSATNGYTLTATGTSNNSFGIRAGLVRTSFSSTCTAANNCSGSLYANLNIMY